jgi:hypothetical protein
MKAILSRSGISPNKQTTACRFIAKSNTKFYETAA